MEVDLALIFAFASNFAPQGTLFCSGQLLSISSNTAVFSLLGTTYGGNGQSTFALPDLRGRAPIGQGQGPGLSNYVLGQAAGTESASILVSNLPAHSHPLNANGSIPNTATPGSTYLAGGPVTGSGPNASQIKTYTTSAPNTTLGNGSIGNTGSNIPLNILQPYLAISYIIIMNGIFPSRN
jgi:microcystin-dependent protein